MSSETTRRLVTVRTVRAISPIPGADRIEVATVDGWRVVVRKGEFQPGDRVVYFEIDSFIPASDPSFEFLRPSSFRQHPISGADGYRLRTARLRGQVSQGLIIPAPPHLRDEPDWTDVTAEYGVVIWEDALPPELEGVAKGMMPVFLRKTREERIQNVAEAYQMLRDEFPAWTLREKLDGMSITFYHWQGVFGVCSRAVDFLDSDSHPGWRLARETGVIDTLPDGFAIQGEIIGPGIAGNPYRLTDKEFRLFSVYDIAASEYRGDWSTFTMCDRLKLDPCPLVAKRALPDTVDELLALADGPSAIGDTGNWREGIVIRADDGDRLVHSFKVASNRYLLGVEEGK